MKYITQIISAAIIGGAIFGATFFAVDTYKKLKSQEIDNEAKYQCALSSRYEVKSQESATVWYPVEELYKKCLEDKNLK